MSSRGVRHVVPLCLLAEVMWLVIMRDLLHVDLLMVKDGGEALKENFQDTVVSFVHSQFTIHDFLTIRRIAASLSTVVVIEDLSFFIHLVRVEEKIIQLSNLRGF